MFRWTSATISQLRNIISFFSLSTFGKMHPESCMFSTVVLFGISITAQIELQNARYWEQNSFNNRKLPAYQRVYGLSRTLRWTPSTFAYLNCLVRSCKLVTNVLRNGAGDVPGDSDELCCWCATIARAKIKSSSLIARSFPSRMYTSNYTGSTREKTNHELCRKYVLQLHQRNATLNLFLDLSL